MIVNIDQNDRNIGGGIIQGTDTVLPLAVNPITGALLIEIIPVNSIGSGIGTKVLPIDANSRNCAGAITDDLNEDIIPLTVDDVVTLPCLRIET